MPTVRWRETTSEVAPSAALTHLEDRSYETADPISRAAGGGR